MCVKKKKTWRNKPGVKVWECCYAEWLLWIRKTAQIYKEKKLSFILKIRCIRVIDEIG